MLLLIGLPVLINAQSTVLQNLIILGNLNKLHAEDSIFIELDDLINQQAGEVIVLFAGDFLDKDGLDSTPNDEELAKLKRLMSVGNEQTQLLFLPGDREWDNGKSKGLKHVKRLEKYIKKNGGKRHHFLTEDGCPGPDVLDIGKTLRIVALNTHWLVHDYKRPEEQDADCDLSTEAEFWDELEDIIRADEKRNIVIAAHHPNLSYGQYAGYKLGKEHFLPPIVGSFIAAYHQNVGNNRDLAKAEMNHFNSKMEDLLKRYQGLIYASGHEFDIQLNERNNNYHINSGSLTKKKASAKGLYSEYRHPNKGLVQIRFFDDGAIDYQVFEIGDNNVFNLGFQQEIYKSPCGKGTKKLPINEFYQPCQDISFTENQEVEAELPKSEGISAGAEYDEVSLLTRWALGRNYRKDWAVPIQNIPYLDMDTTAGGLIAYAKGGGAQTRSVRLKSADGQVFAFRSVNKTPTQKKDKELMAGIMGYITQDYTSHHHPYGPLIVTKLLDELDIPNPDGELYVLPDHAALGIYRQEYKGMLGWLEKRPKSKKKGRKPYRNADKALATSEVNKMMVDDHDHQMDVKSYLNARLIDMWVVDYDRHGGNSSYLGYGDKKKMTFFIFPKDRDKAFNRMDGFYRLTDLPMLAKTSLRFRKSHYGIKALNGKSRHMDRRHLLEFQKDDLLKATKEFTDTMTDEVIDNAVATLPKESYQISGEEIANVLKIRRDRMPDLINDYYRLLAKKIHFIGSNKREIFEVKRAGNGDVLVEMYKKKKDGSKGKLLKKRLCKKSETKEIHLYGLGGEDDFNIAGDVRKSILIRVIGGKSKDEITDKSKVNGFKKYTKVYDYKKKDKVIKGADTKEMKLQEAISFEMDDFYQDDFFLIYPLLSYNNNDGLIFTLTGSGTKQKFNKPGFGNKYKFTLLGTTNERFNFSASTTFRHVLGKWDLEMGVNTGSPDFLFPEFFGLGNELVINDSLRKLDYYENDMKTIEGQIGLKRTFWERSSVSIEALSEYHDVAPDSEDPSSKSIYDIYSENLITTLIGPRIILDIDFRDDNNFPTKGIQLKSSNYTFVNEESNWNIGGKAEAEISSFWTLGAKTPLTLGVRGGGSKSYGETPFYYQSFLGQTNRLRGYRKNRFGGTSAIYVNTDLRFHFGTLRTAIVPLHWGIFGFYDIGRTFYELDEDSDVWHSAYGGGIYVIPYKNQFNLVATIAHSVEEKALLSFGIGFFVK